MENYFKNKVNVISEIVVKDLCIGCGVCVAMCPHQILKFRVTQIGTYEPFEVRECINKCRACLQVCPFYPENENETNLGDKHFTRTPLIKYLEPIGYYNGTYAGFVFDKNLRSRSSSGGLATWFLTELIKNHIVDYVVCATQIKNLNLFRLRICKSIDDIQSCSGSHYCPVESITAFTEILKVPGRYAVTGLPCQLKAIKLATQKNVTLRNRIFLLVGLTCGQLKTINYTLYLKALAGADGGPSKIKYREKIRGIPVNNFCFSSTNSKGERSEVFFRDGPSQAWTNRWFTPNPCNYCDDVFSEVADITFMDAWLPRYMRETGGTNLIITRTSIVKDMLIKGNEENKIYIEAVKPEDVIESQDGVILFKRKQLAYRLYLLKKKFNLSLNKRTFIGPTLNLLQIYDNAQKEKMRHISQEAFLRYYDKSTKSLDLDSFHDELRPYLIRINRINIIHKAIKWIDVVKKIIKNKTYLST